MNRFNQVVKVFIFIALFCGGYVFGDSSVPHNNTNKTESSFLLQEVKYLGQDLISPFYMEEKYQVFLLSGFIGLLSTPKLIKEIGKPTRKYFLTEKPLGQHSYDLDKIGELMWPNLIFTVGGLALAGVTAENQYLHQSIVMLKATLIAQGWTTLLKEITQVPRPGFPESTTSFPSGHATAAFAFASVVDSYYDQWWITVPGYMLATLISLSRIQDDKHRLNEVMAGALIGWTYGMSISQMDKNRRVSRRTHSSQQKNKEPLFFISSDSNHLVNFNLSLNF